MHPQQQQSAPAALHAGDTLPDLRLTILGGDADRTYLGLPDGAAHMRLGDIQARYVVVQFFNCLCAECLYELEKMDALGKSLSHMGRKVRIIGIAVHDEARRVAAFRKREGVLFPLFVDRSDTLPDLFGFVAPPAACLLEREGLGVVIRRVVAGTREERERFLEDVRLVVGTAEE